MSTLIIGVLFVVAILALVGLVFVLRSEPAAPKAVPASPPTNATPEVGATSQPATSAHRDVPSSSVTSATTVPIPVPTDEPHFAMANGQFHELAEELHTLHEQSQEIEHRLSILSEMIERIERSQDAHIAEEYSSLIDRQATR